MAKGKTRIGGYSETQVNAAADGIGATVGFDNFLFGAIVVAFIIYVTAKGELPTYLSLFLYTPPGASTGPARQTVGETPGTPGLAIGSWADFLTKGLPSSWGEFFGVR